MLKNKNANILAFDEIIGKKTSFEGNTNEDSIKEINIIIRYLIDEQCYTESVTKEILEELSSILLKTKDKIQREKDPDNDYFLIGWPKHSILIFYEKITGTEQYDVGIINAGQGVEIQGAIKNLCNAIIIFKNISQTKLYNFLDNYDKFSFYSEDEFGNYSNDYGYYSFYSLLLNNLIDANTYDVNFYDLIMNTENVIALQMSSQHIGSCSFTNHIYYLSYLLYKKVSKTDYNKIYSKWFALAKNKMKKKLYNEIIDVKNHPKKKKILFHI